MSEHADKRQHMDAEDAERVQQQIDTTQGPGPVLDQDRPAAMPLFDENDRARGTLDSAIDPAEFAELGQRSGEELDGVRPIDHDEPGVAGRAARSDVDDAAQR